MSRDALRNIEDVVDGASDACTVCGHEHRGYVHGFTCAECRCAERPGRVEWEHSVEATIPAGGTAAQRRALVVKLLEMCADAAHWNLAHPNEKPIIVDTDIRADVAKKTVRLARGGKA